MSAGVIVITPPRASDSDFTEEQPPKKASPQRPREAHVGTCQTVDSSCRGLAAPILMTRSEEEICKTRADEDLHDRTAQCRSSLPHNTRQLRLPAGEDQHEDPSDTPEQAPTTKILLRPNHHSSSPSSPRKPSRGPTHRQSATCQLRRRVRPAHQETRMGARFSRRRPKGGRRREKRRPSPDRAGLGFPLKSLLRGWERSKKTPWRRLQGGERRLGDAHRRRCRWPARAGQAFARSLWTTIPMPPARAGPHFHWPAHPRRGDRTNTTPRPPPTSPSDNTDEPDLATTSCRQDAELQDAAVRRSNRHQNLEGRPPPTPTRRRKDRRPEPAPLSAAAVPTRTGARASRRPETQAAPRRVRDPSAPPDAVATRAGGDFFSTNPCCYMN